MEWTSWIHHIVERLSLCLDFFQQWDWTATHRAAINNHPSIVRRLVTVGAAVDTKDIESKTPLWYAACNGHVACAALLVSGGANPHNER